MVYQCGEEIAPNAPQMRGLAVGRFACASLPVGLRIDPESGIITGRPTIESDSMHRIITVANEHGETTYELMLGVSAKPPRFKGCVVQARLPFPAA